MSDKYAGARPKERDSQKQLRQREMLSSAESANHFITKTRVGGALKNSRQVVAPIGTHGAASRAAKQSDIHDFQ